MKLEANMERDERNRRQLIAAGFEVLELWECEIADSLEGCIVRVQRALAAARDA